MLTILDVKKLEELWHSEATPNDFDGVLLVAALAAELVAARGGLTLEQIQSLSRQELVDRVIGQGATVAMLQAKVEEETERANSLHRTWQGAEQENVALRAKVERLKRMVDARDTALTLANRQRNAAESRLAAILEAGAYALTVLENIQALRKSANEPLGAVPRAAAQLRKALEGDAPNHPGFMDGSPNHSMPSNGWGGEHEVRDLVETITVTGGMAGEIPKVIHQSTRYPCSITCTHDDAATPGHPERVKERSAAFKIAGTDEERESVLWQEGADAMRAACWQAVVERLVRHGLHRFREDFKRAIEGAAP